MNKIRIEIPMLPPKELNPNWRGHWSPRALAASQYRTMSKVFALKDSRFSRPCFKRARLSICLVIPDQRHIRDTDNALASLKPAIDGCVDAGIIADDNPSRLKFDSIDYDIDWRRSPLTVLEFEEI